MRPHSVSIDTFAGKLHVEWDPKAAVTPIGQLSFFIDFLKTAQLFEPWVQDCPLNYTSNNAPRKRDVLGTLLLSILSGHRRYAHITTIRSDNVNPKLLGMKKVVSEDAARRAFLNVPESDAAKWQKLHLHRCWETLLTEPWILDIDTTVKPLYGKQEGAKIGYNPNKPGRPSHVYHTYAIAGIRQVLDVEVQAGNQTASSYSRPGLFTFIDSLPIEKRPQFIRGDCGFGNEKTIKEAEDRNVKYLFKLRQTGKVKLLAKELLTSEWTNAGNGWEGTESSLKLTGWSKTRRVVVLRREQKDKDAAGTTTRKGDVVQVAFDFLKDVEVVKKYKYAVLVTSLEYEVLALAQLYRDRADVENIFDEMKNQWGWGGYVTQDLKRCQIMARNIAMVYNWWSIFVRLAISEKHSEAITSRPLLLHSVGKASEHAGQQKLTITSTHAKRSVVVEILSKLAGFLQALRLNAEQLNWGERWRKILSCAFKKYLEGRLLGSDKSLNLSG